MGSRDAAVTDIDLLPKWMAERAVLLRRIEYRERELLEIHEDYLALEQRCAGLMAVILRQAQRDRAEREEWKRAKSANECNI